MLGSENILLALTQSPSSRRERQRAGNSSCAVRGKDSQKGKKGKASQGKEAERSPKCPSIACTDSHGAPLSIHCPPSPHPPEPVVPLEDFCTEIMLHSSLRRQASCGSMHIRCEKHPRRWGNIWEILACFCSS